MVRSSDGSIVSTFDLPKTALLQFSPLNTILVTWQPYSSKTTRQPETKSNSEYDQMEEPVAHRLEAICDETGSDIRLTQRAELSTVREDDSASLWCVCVVAESQDSAQGEANLQLWEVQSGQLVKALYQKKVDSWSVCHRCHTPRM